MEFLSLLLVLNKGGRNLTSLCFSSFKAQTTWKAVSETLGWEWWLPSGVVAP